MQSDEFEKSPFGARLQQVLDQRDGVESDARLCELAYADEDAATILKAAELIASPPSMAMYPSVNFADSILAKIRAEDALEMQQRNAPIWRRKAGLYWGMSVAVAMSLAIGLGIWTSQGDSNVVAKNEAVQPEAPKTTSKEVGGKKELESDEARRALINEFAVSEQKFAELRDGLNPFRSTLNATIHVLRSTVPTRTPHPQQKPLEGKPSTAVIHAKWIA